MIAQESALAGMKERLDSSTLRAIQHRVDQQMISTLETEAAPYSLDDLRLAFGVTRLGLRSEVEWLPDHAFEEQGSDPDGNEIWSAGQIVNHLGHTQIGLTAWLLELMRVEPPAGPNPLIDLTDVEYPGLLTREQSLHVLDVADRELEGLFDVIPLETTPVNQASHPRFGRAGVKGSVLAMAIHESSHLHQLMSLRFKPALQCQTTASESTQLNPT